MRTPRRIEQTLPRAAWGRPDVGPGDGADGVDPTQPSALLLGTARSRGVLTAARALGRSGWRVGIGTPTPSSMVTATRWRTAAHVVERPRGDGEDFRRSLAAAVTEGGYDVVFGGGDDWLVALVTWRDDVPAIVPHPAHAVVAAALDKVELGRGAVAAGLATPRTRSATPAAVAAWTGPVVVKCRSHWRPGSDPDHRLDSRRYPSLDAARPRLAEIRRAGLEPLLQEPVGGDLSAVVGLVDDGRLLGVVQQQASGVWPTPSGSSTRAVSVAVDPDLVARCEVLLGDLGWHGLVELQFLTPPGGDPHLIDLNGRFYGSLALAVTAGGNLPDAWGRQALGQPLPTLPTGRVGVRYHWAAGDLRRALTDRRGGLAADIGSSLRWAWGRDVASVLDRRDLGPVLHLVSARLPGWGPRRRG